MPVTGNDNKGFDPSKYGAVEVTEQNSSFDPSKYGATEIKKKVGGSNLSVGQNGQLQKSSPTVSQSQSQGNSQPTFFQPDIKQLQQQQISPSESTINVAPKEAMQAQENKENIPIWNKEKADYKEKVIKNTPTAITNAAVKSLKIKGIDPNNAAQLSKEKQHFQDQVDNGNATVGFSKDGTPGLVDNPGLFSSFHDHMMQAINENKDSREYHNMDKSDRIKYLNSKLQETQTPYIGVKPTPLGSVGAMGGGMLPTFGLYAAGAAAGGVIEAAAPETGGLSNLAMKPVMSFVMNAGSEANKSELNGQLQRYAQIKQKNPNMNDSDAYDEAQKGTDVDRLSGIAQAALFSETGGVLGKSVTGNILKEMAKSGVDIGAKSALIEGAKDVGHNMEGVTNKSTSEVLGDMGKAFEENAPVGAALHGIMGAITGVSKIPGIIKSSLKYDVVTKMNPEEIQGELNKNVQSGAITPEDANTAEVKLKQFSDAVNKVPASLSDESKASVAGLILKRDNIDAEAKTKDQSPSIQQVYKDQRDAIDNQINEILRTGKPLEHEINEATGQTYEKPTFDNIAAFKVKNLADKISKGKEVTDPEDLQTEQNFPNQLEAKLKSISNEEKSSNQGNEKPSTELSDNINRYLSEKNKIETESKVSIPTEETGSANAGIDKNNEQTKEEISSQLNTNQNGKGNENRQGRQRSSEGSDQVNNTTGAENAPVNKAQEQQPTLSENEEEALYGKKGEPRIKLDFNAKGKPIIEPEIPIADMNSEDMRNYADKVKSLLKNQEKEFENKTEAEKEAGGYNDTVDNVADLRETAQRLNLIENSENLSDLASSSKSTLLNLKDKPDEYDMALLNGIRKKAEKLKIPTEDLIKTVLKKVGSKYADEDDAKFMMKYILKKMIPEEQQPTIKEEPPIVKDNQKENIQSQNKNNENAIQQPKTGEVFQRQQGENGSTGSERGRVEQSQQGNESPNENQKSETSGEEKVTGVKKAITKPLRTELGLPEVEIPKMGEDADELQKAKVRVDSGESNPRDLVDRILTKNEGYKDEKDVMDMQYYAHQIHEKSEDLIQQISEAKTPEEKADLSGKLQQLSDESDRQTEAALIAGNQWGRIGNRMQIVIDGGFNPSRERAFIKDAYGGEVPKEVNEKLAAIIKERDEAIAAKKEIEEKLKQRAAKAGVEKIKKQAEKTAKRDETKEKLKKEEQQLLDQIKNALKKDFGTLNAGIPFPKETIETLGKLAVNYFKQGALTVEALVDKMYNALKDDVKGIDKKQIRDIIAEYEPLTIERETARLTKKAENLEDKIIPPTVKTEKGELSGVSEPTDFTPKPARAKLEFRKNNEWVKARQRVANAEYKIKQLKRQAFESKKNWYQKGLMWAGRLVRLSILSGKAVLYKLAAAATIGGAAKRIPEQAVGAIWSQIFKGISEKAPIEGGLNVNAEAKFYKEFFDPKKFGENAWSILKTGQSNLSKRLGSAEYEHVPILYLPTDLHQIIKDPVKRATFEASCKYGRAHAEKNGLDVTHPLVINSIENAAFKRANYEIFQESNALSRKFKEWKSDMEKKGNIGATGKFVADYMIPVSTVPTNIARRIATTSPFGLIRGGIKVLSAYRKGIENLSNDEADAVMKQLKQGTLGTALWLTGWFAASHFGGLYSKFNPNKKRDEGDLKSDEMEVNGELLPKPVQHALPFEVLQTAATARHIYDNSVKIGDNPFQSIYNAGLGAIGSQMEQIPVLETPVHAIEATQDPYEAEKLKQDMKRRVEPQILRETGVIPKDEPKSKVKGGLHLPKQPKLKLKI